MASLQRALATLRIGGDLLVPEEISMRLGCQPTFAQVKGEVLHSKSGTRIARSSMWQLEATVTEPWNLDYQVAELLGKMTTDLDVWKSLAASFKVDLFCGWFMASSNDGVSVSPVTLLSLGQRNIQLELDIYDPDTDA